MNGYRYDSLTVKEQALFEIGYELLQTLGDSNRYEWLPQNSKRYQLRFTSREQATDYAYQQSIILGRSLS